MTSMSDFKWLLFNSETNEESGPYDVQELRKLVVLIKPQERAQYFIWNGSDADWIPLDKILTHLRPPPPIKAKGAFALKKEEVVLESKRSSAFEEKRRHPRKNLRLKVIVISGSNSWRTYSDNVSLGGLSLVKALPLDFLSHQCHLIVSRVGHESKMLELKGSFIAVDGSESRRIKLSPESEINPVLLEWLNSINEKAKAA